MKCLFIFIYIIFSSSFSLVTKTTFMCIKMREQFWNVDTIFSEGNFLRSMGSLSFSINQQLMQQLMSLTRWVIIIEKSGYSSRRNNLVGNVNWSMNKYAKYSGDVQYRGTIKLWILNYKLLIKVNVQLLKDIKLTIKLLFVEIKMNVQTVPIFVT